MSMENGKQTLETRLLFDCGALRKRDKHDVSVVSLDRKLAKLAVVLLFVVLEKSQ